MGIEYASSLELIESGNYTDEEIWKRSQKRNATPSTRSSPDVSSLELLESGNYSDAEIQGGSRKKRDFVKPETTLEKWFEAGNSLSPTGEAVLNNKVKDNTVREKLSQRLDNPENVLEKGISKIKENTEKRFQPWLTADNKKKTRPREKIELIKDEDYKREIAPILRVIDDMERSERFAEYIKRSYNDDNEYREWFDNKTDILEMYTYFDKDLDFSHRSVELITV